MILKNVAVRLGVANGSVAILRHMVFPNDVTFSTVNYKFAGEENATPLRKPSKLPHIPWLQLVGQNTQLVDAIDFPRDSLPQELPQLPGMFPLPIGRWFKRSYSIGTRGTLSTKLRHFPIAAASALTAFKVQGLTLPHVAIGNLTKPPATPGGYYVAFSRIRSCESLSLLHNWFPPDNPNKFNDHVKIKPELENELRRLSDISRRTVESFHQNQQ